MAGEGFTEVGADSCSVIAKYLCEMRNFDGAVVVVFQPNEDVSPAA